MFFDQIKLVLNNVVNVFKTVLRNINGAYLAGSMGENKTPAGEVWFIEEVGFPLGDPPS